MTLHFFLVLTTLAKFSLSSLCPALQQDQILSIVPTSKNVFIFIQSSSLDNLTVYQFPESQLLTDSSETSVRCTPPAESIAHKWPNIYSSTPLLNSRTIQGIASLKQQDHASNETLFIGQFKVNDHHQVVVTGAMLFIDEDKSTKTSLPVSSDADKLTAVHFGDLTGWDFTKRTIWIPNSGGNIFYAIQAFNDELLRPMGAFSFVQGVLSPFVYFRGRRFCTSNASHIVSVPSNGNYSEKCDPVDWNIEYGFYRHGTIYLFSPLSMYVFADIFTGDVEVQRVQFYTHPSEQFFSDQDVQKNQTTVAVNSNVFSDRAFSATEGGPNLLTTVMIGFFVFLTILALIACFCFCKSNKKPKSRFQWNTCESKKKILDIKKKKHSSRKVISSKKHSSQKKATTSPAMATDKERSAKDDGKANGSGVHDHKSAKSKKGVQTSLKKSTNTRKRLSSGKRSANSTGKNFRSSQLSKWFKSKNSKNSNVTGRGIFKEIQRKYSTLSRAKPGKSHKTPKV